MAKIKQPMDPGEEQWLAVKAQLLELLRDPAALQPVRRFCRILWEGTPRGEHKMRDMGIYINAVANGAFPEWTLEKEREQAEAREAARRTRRLRRLAVA